MQLSIVMKNLIVKWKLTATGSHHVQLLTPTRACMLSLVCAYIHTYIQSTLLNVHVYVYMQEDIYARMCMCECEREREKVTSQHT